MVKVTDLKSGLVNHDLPIRFLDLLPEDCPSCGNLMCISETLTGLQCENPRCSSKIVMRIKAICTDLGILGFGESTIEKFVNYYNITNPLNVLALEEGMVISDEVSEKVSGNIIAQIVEKKNFLLWEYVKIANIPNVQTSAMDIFKGYKSLEEAYADIEAGGVSFIQYKLGIQETGVLSTRSMKVYKSLMEYKDDLFECVENVNIIDISEVKELNVVCSDQVGGSFNKKSEFYGYINTVFGDKVHVNFLPSVTRNIDYLVWAGADGSQARYTSKVKTVEGYNSKGYNIPIVTASQFISIIEEM